MSRPLRELRSALTFPRTRKALVELVFNGRQVEPLGLRVILWWGASLVVLGAYALLRGKMDDLGMPVHGAEIERATLGSLPTVWLQDHIWRLAPHELEWGSVLVHSSWFFVPMLAGLFVSLRRPDRVGSFFRWWIALELVALPLFALFPMRPPWMESSEVTRIIALRFGGHIDDSNALAAMPSLHVAFPLVISLWFFRERWRMPGIVMLAYTCLVASEVVFSGEHYVVDVLGAAMTAAAIALASRIDARAAVSRVSSLAFRRSVPRTGQLKPALEPAVNARGEGGQALIEFAFVLPFILLFLLTLVDFGLAIDRRQVLQHAVRDGVRFGAVGNSVADVQAHTVDQAGDLIAVSDVDVCYVDENGNGNPGNAGDSIRVTAHHTYSFTVGGGELLTAFGIPVPTIDMDPSATLRLESTVTGATACP